MFIEAIDASGLIRAIRHSHAAFSATSRAPSPVCVGPPCSPPQVTLQSARRAHFARVGALLAGGALSPTDARRHGGAAHPDVGLLLLDQDLVRDDP
eukprot:5785496-Pleurochrysis_carterae.AAC.1